MKYEKRLIALLAAIQFSHILDFFIIMPLGPMLMRVFGVNAQEFAILVSSYTFASAICGFTSAFFVDFFDRKRALLFGFSGFILGTFLCSQANSFEMLLGARIFAGCFGGIVNGAVFTIIGDVIPEERRGKATGTVMAAFSIASVVGVPIGLYFAEMLGWHAPFMLLVLFSLAVAFGIGKYVEPMRAHLRDTTHKIDLRTELTDFANVLRDINHLKAFAFSVCINMAAFSIIPFISPYLVYNVGLPESRLPLIYLCGGSFTFFTSRWIGRLSDRYGRYPVYLTVALASLVPILLLTNLPPVPLVAMLAVTTLFMVLVSGRFVPAMALITSSANPARRGAFMGVFNAVHHMATGMASIVGGYLIVTEASGLLSGYQKNGYLAAILTLFSLYLAKNIKIRKT
ncbi:MFS transporter [bacterium]|nr:MFS transporter [bacterium]